MSDILLITPPFVQVNSPYPATAYLKGYLCSRGIDARQYDLSVELANEIFSSGFLSKVFGLTESFFTCDGRSKEQSPEAGEDTDNQAEVNGYRMFSLRDEYVNTVDSVMKFLRGEDNSLANLICSPSFLPQASRFTTIADLDQTFGQLGTTDCAKYLSTLYLQDISDYIRTYITEHFEIVRYGEQLALSVPSFSALESFLTSECNIIEEQMLKMLAQAIERHTPAVVGFTIPFPGNLIMSLRCAAFLKENYPEIKIAAGGGYPTTELRSLKDKKIFDYFDYIILDDGERPLERIVRGETLSNTFTKDGYFEKTDSVSHLQRGCPDFSELPFGKYFSLFEVTNPMHKLWSDGRWNKMMLAHGCYWGKCSFCDTALDYIKCYDAADAATLVDWMECVFRQTGSSGFHFVDEAAPPKLLRDISLEIIRRGLKFSWWTNIRFEKSYTGDLCRLMSTAGCIAVSGGLEVASDRLLEFINKGISIETATMAMRNFFYAGIMVHTYLMYGLPTQTLQDTVDSLEIVRQMFKAQLIDSGFWHRYAMTIHSDSGSHPDKYGVKRKNDHVNTFANNEVLFSEDRRYNIQDAGQALRSALGSYMAGEGLDTPAHKWFTGKAPKTTVENTEITDHIIKPDNSRIFDASARVVWTGNKALRDTGGLRVISNSEDRHFNFESHDADFLMEVISLCGNLSEKITLDDIKNLYSKYNSQPFAVFYHSKKWDRLREYGLLQI